jgi:multiple sugar transport system substrate-binding protein
MRRLLAAVAVLLSLAGSSAAADNETLVVWAMGEEGKKIAVMARRFEAQNPGVRVETQAIPWEAAHAKLLTSVVGGIPPDVSQMGTTWMAEFAAMKALAPLDEKAAASPWANPRAFFAGSLQTCYVDGALYGVPWYVDTRVLFYRKDLLAEVGFPEAPRTWQEFKTAAKRLAARRGPDGKRRYGLALGSRAWTDLLLFVWQNGGNPLKPSSPEFVEAMRYYVSFFREGIAPSKDAADVDLFHAFKTGYLPMFISGPWMVELTRKELPELWGKWGVSMLPGQKNRTSFVGGSNLVVFNDSRKKDLAWRFVEFMSHPDRQAEWFEITTDLPSTPEAWKREVFRDRPLIRVFGEQMYQTASPPTVPEWEQLANALENTMEKIVLQDAAQDARIPEQLAALEATFQALRGDKAASRTRGWRPVAVAAACLAALGAGLLLWRRRADRAGSGRRVNLNALGQTVAKGVWGYLFILPAVLLLLVFLFIPIAVSFLMSLTDLNIFNLNQWNQIQWVGADNYVKALRDPIFWKSLRNTLYFAGFGVPLTILLSLIAAVALNQKFVQLRSLFRVALFSPVVTTIVAVAVVWRWLYNPEYGALNWLLQSVGLEPLHWLADAKTALPSLILMAAWKNFGYNMVIFLGGLQTIPETHYEAARIDGANSWQCFRYITLPGLAPTMLLVVILTTIGYLQFFAEPYVMTKGGPLDSTMSIVLYMYNQGFRFFNLGYASALSYVLFGLIFCFTFIQLRLTKGGFEANA